MAAEFMSTLTIHAQLPDEGNLVYVEVVCTGQGIIVCGFPKNLVLIQGTEITAPASLIRQLERRHHVNFPRV